MTDHPTGTMLDPEKLWPVAEAVMVELRRQRDDPHDYITHDLCVPEQNTADTGGIVYVDGYFHVGALVQAIAEALVKHGVLSTCERDRQ